VNKQVLGTILGAALLGLAKSKGSSARKMPLDDFFKKKVGNQKQTFKIHFDMNYAPFWDNHYQSSRIQYNFEEYVGKFLDLIHDIANGFKAYLDEECRIYGNNQYLFYRIEDEEEARRFAAEQGDAEGWLNYINYYEDDVLFESWCSTRSMYWDDELASEYTSFDDWEYLEKLRSNSEFHLKFQESVDAYDIQKAIIEDRLDEAKYLIDNHNIFDYDEDEYWVGNFLHKLQEEGEFEGLEWEDVDEFNALQHQIIQKKEELKALLTDWKGDGIFCPIDEWLFDWNEEVNGDAGYVRGVLEVKLNIETINVSKTQWMGFIEIVLHKAYQEWYREEKPSNTIGDESDVSDPVSLGLEPNIWAKKKSNLRKR